MPVPRLQRQVSSTPIAGVTLTAAETPESEGAGLAAAQARTHEARANLYGGLASIATSEAAKIAETAQKQADATALLTADNTLATWEKNRLYVGPDAALSQKGENSFGLPEKITDEYNAQADAVAAKLPARLQADFAQRRAQRAENLDLTIARYVAGETQAHTANELQAGLDNHRDAAIANALDPVRLNAEIKDGLASLAKVGPSLGLGPEELKKQTDNFLTATHVGVIQALIANDQPGKADAYFQASQEQIVGKARAEMKQQVEDAGIRKQGQLAADKIVGEGGTLKEQIEKAKALEDPTGKLRDAVQSRLEHQASLDDVAERKAQEQGQRSLYDVIDTAKPEALPSIDELQRNPAWSTVSLEGRSAVMSYLERKAKGLGIKTDWRTFYGMMDEAGRDASKFVTENLLPLKAKLDDPEWKQLVGIQLSMRSGDTRGAEHQIEGFRSSEQIITDSLSQYGIDPTDKTNAAAVAALRRMVDLQVEVHQKGTGKKIGNVDLQDIVDKILGQKVDTPGSWWNILPGGKAGPWGSDTSSVVKLTVGDVPAADRRLIESGLRATGRPVTDATVLDYYMKLKLVGGKK
jgi:hypothetical protein